jgi:hypothetical protein
MMKKQKTIEDLLNKDIIEKCNYVELDKCYRALIHDKRTFLRYMNSLENYEHIYENLLKFLEYRKTVKSTAGLYDAKYISLLRNTSLQRAEVIVKEKKISKSTSKEQFIKRHGEAVGLEKFNKFRETSKQSSDNLKDTFSEQELVLFYRKHSVRCFEYYLERNLAKSVEDAKKMASEFQLKNAGVNFDYYVSRGISKEDAEFILSAINSKKSCSYALLKERYPDTYKERIQSRREKLRATVGAIELLDEYESYRHEVDKYTGLSVALNIDKISNLHLRSRDYHLDHIYSKRQGFLDNIDPEIIGHWTNLRVVDASYNCKKQGKCDKSYKQLMEDYKRGQNEN